MEFEFNINNLFGQDISVLNSNLTPYRTTPATVRNYRSQLCSVIDQMGAASAKAQGLHGAITTASRMTTSNHSLYVMKDATAANGKGSVVGFLKVGIKKLFVYDAEGCQHEIEPLCALDFYVHESRQRTGCGRKIFEFMLQAEGVKPHQMAVDRPSHKFLSFLEKHYQLRNSVTQRNNFVIFDAFFKSPRHRRKQGNSRPPAHPQRRLESRNTDTQSSYRRNTNIPPRNQQSPITQLRREEPLAVDPPRPSSASATCSSIGRILCWYDSDDQSTDDLRAASATPEQAKRPSSALSDDLKMKSHHLNLETDNGAASNAMKSNRLPPIQPGRSNQSSPFGNQPPHDFSAPSSLVSSPKHTIAPADIYDHSSPPSIRRDGPSNDYVSLNSKAQHSAAFSPSKEENHSRMPAPQQPDPFSTRSYKPQDNLSSWNVFGVPQTRIIHQVPTTNNGKASLTQEQQLNKFRYYKQW